MSHEGQNVDCESLKVVTGKNACWDDLAKDCVALANAQIIRVKSAGVVTGGLES